MIFSPVVAPGIGEGAARWVEDPKNLINVAVTRARLALFVVADFDMCRRQVRNPRRSCQSMLTRGRESAKRPVESELELFSLMVVQGWNPRVHHVEQGYRDRFCPNARGQTFGDRGGWSTAAAEIRPSRTKHVIHSFAAWAMMFFAFRGELCAKRHPS